MNAIMEIYAVCFSAPVAKEATGPSSLMAPAVSGGSATLNLPHSLTQAQLSFAQSYESLNPHDKVRRGRSFWGGGAVVSRLEFCLFFRPMSNVLSLVYPLPLVPSCPFL